jgi:hypothetical protein
MSEEEYAINGESWHDIRAEVKISENQSIWLVPEAKSKKIEKENLELKTNISKLKELLTSDYRISREDKENMHIGEVIMFSELFENIDKLISQ